MLRRICLALWLTASAAAAEPLVQPVLVIDVQELVRDSARGQLLLAQKQAMSDAYQADGKRIADALEAEEQRLADLRATMSEAEFAPLAVEFDRKVVASRRENADRARTLSAQIEALDAAFQAELGPVVVEIMRTRGAGVVLQKRAVFFNGISVDITRDVIEALDGRSSEESAQ